MNLYGWTKHVFDPSRGEDGRARQPRPPQWVRLKFFNVFGPNEYHKRSTVAVVEWNWTT